VQIVDEHDDLNDMNEIDDLVIRVRLNDLYHFKSNLQLFIFV